MVAEREEAETLHLSEKRTCKKSSQSSGCRHAWQLVESFGRCAGVSGFNSRRN